MPGRSASFLYPARLSVVFQLKSDESRLVGEKHPSDHQDEKDASSSYKHRASVVYQAAIEHQPDQRILSDADFALPGGRCRYRSVQLVIGVNVGLDAIRAGSLKFGIVGRRSESGDGHFKFLVFYR
jgi:hypothetical protein